MLPDVKDVMGPTYDASIDLKGEKDPRAELLWRGGETAAMMRIQQYFWEEDALGLDLAP